MTQTQAFTEALILATLSASLSVMPQAQSIRLKTLTTLLRCALLEIRRYKH